MNSQPLPDSFSLVGNKVLDCKYGENAWQSPAALYSTATDDPLALTRFKVIEGTPPSYNNMCDIERLLQTTTHIAAAFALSGMGVPQIAVGAKHGNACGSGAKEMEFNAAAVMMEGDPIAIFGGLVMTNFAITADRAEQISGNKFDGIIAPSISTDAISMLRRKHDKCRFIVNEALGSLGLHSLDIAPRPRYVRGSLLYQPNYTFVLDLNDPCIKSYGRQIDMFEKMDILLAWAIGSTSNSNTITLVRKNKLIGNAVGQQDRVGAAKLAIERATRSKHPIEGAVAYSDSFFPFPDGPQLLIDAGVSVIFTSSGSMKDRETIELCEKHGVALLMIPDEAGRGFYGH